MSISAEDSTMQMWEGLIQKAKDGGLDAIDTYVFWNLHEPSPGNVRFLVFSLTLCFGEVSYLRLGTNVELFSLFLVQF